MFVLLLCALHTPGNVLLIHVIYIDMEPDYKTLYRKLSQCFIFIQAPPGSNTVLIIITDTLELRWQVHIQLYRDQLLKWRN